MNMEVQTQAGAAKNEGEEKQAAFEENAARAAAIQQEIAEAAAQGDFAKIGELSAEGQQLKSVNESVVAEDHQEGLEMNAEMDAEKSRQEAEAAKIAAEAAAEQARFAQEAAEKAAADQAAAEKLAEEIKGGAKREQPMESAQAVDATGVSREDYEKIDAELVAHNIKTSGNVNIMNRERDWSKPVSEDPVYSPDNYRGGQEGMERDGAEQAEILQRRADVVDRAQDEAIAEDRERTEAAVGEKMTRDQLDLRASDIGNEGMKPNGWEAVKADLDASGWDYRKESTTYGSSLNRTLDELIMQNRLDDAAKLVEIFGIEDISDGRKEKVTGDVLSSVDRLFGDGRNDGLTLVKEMRYLVRKFGIVHPKDYRILADKVLDKCLKRGIPFGFHNPEDLSLVVPGLEQALERLRKQ